MYSKTATALIDSAALQQNFFRLKQLAPKSKVVSVLKANAYGHGLERIAKALTATDAIGVARLDEALALRAVGITKPIILLEGFFDASDLPVIAVNRFETVVHNEQQLLDLENSLLPHPIKVWLKVDTGMHRLGISPSDLNQYYQRLKACHCVQNEIVLMSHLACADEPSNQHTQQQINLFNQLTRDIQEDKSLANSAGILAWPESQMEWIRPGLLLFGVSPMCDSISADINFSPVMTLKSKLIAIRDVVAGDTIGYGAAYHCRKDTTIGVVAIGYGDGYPRHAETGTPVLVNGRRVPIVGRVSMDMITVDLGQDSTDSVGDEAVMWGRDLPIEDVAKCASTIPYELLCNITRRVQFDVI